MRGPLVDEGDLFSIDQKRSRLWVRGYVAGFRNVGMIYSDAASFEASGFILGFFLSLALPQLFNHFTSRCGRHLIHVLYPSGSLRPVLRPSWKFIHFEFSSS